MPSRVMKELGVFTGQSLSPGIGSSAKKIREVTEELMKILKEVEKGARK